jgi:transcriptional regulator with XRE-family HTH domain
MSRKAKRPALGPEAARRNLEMLARLGGEVRLSRKRRRMTQARLAQRAGMAAMSVSRIERGLGGGHSLDTWQRIGLALGRPLRVELSRDVEEEPVDVGHLAVQELLLRLARHAGYDRTFELATRSGDPARSVDVALRDDRGRRLILLEAWNSFGDIGAGARSFDRKLAEAAQFAVATGGDAPHAVYGCWVVRATARNRALLARYPEIFATRFRGSSAGWISALTQGARPPADPGLVWSDVAATRIFAWRRR